MQRFKFASAYMENLFKTLKTLRVEKKQSGFTCWVQCWAVNVPVDFHILRLVENKLDNDGTNRQTVLGLYECLSKPLWMCLEVFKISKRGKSWMYFLVRLMCFFWLVGLQQVG